MHYAPNRLRMVCGVLLGVLVSALFFDELAHRQASVAEAAAGYASPSTRNQPLQEQEPSTEATLTRQESNPEHNVEQQICPPNCVVITFMPIASATRTPTRTPTPVSIGNFVWDDLDRDGRQDAGEPGLAGIELVLWSSNLATRIDTTLSDEDGSYRLVSPGPGSYRIQAILPSSRDQFSPKDQAGGDDQLDSDINPSGTYTGFTSAFTIASNVISTTIYDVGIIKYRPPTPTRTPTPISVGNQIWEDLNGNGIQDAGEPEVADVTVQIWNSTKTALFDEAVSNASGNYQLTVPGPGDYRVRVLLPPGASFTLKDATDDQKDSDINPSGADGGFSDVYTFANNLISITSIDIGLRNVPDGIWASPTRTPTVTVAITNTPTTTNTVAPATRTQAAASTATSAALAPKPFKVNLPLISK